MPLLPIGQAPLTVNALTTRVLWAKSQHSGELHRVEEWSDHMRQEASSLPHPPPHLEHLLTSRMKGSTGMKVPVLSESSVRVRTQCMRSG